MFFVCDVGCGVDFYGIGDVVCVEFVFVNFLYGWKCL